MTLKIEDFNVAAIYCDNLKKSLDFYVKVLGLNKITEVDGGVQLRLNSPNGLSVYLQGGYPRDTRNYSASKISLCFSTPSVRETWSEATQMGLPINFDYKEISETHAMFCLLDPSGNQIMFMGPP